MVDDDLRFYPYSSSELSDDCKENHYLPYGCTFLGCYIYGQYGIFVQCGDGDIFALFKDGKTKSLVADDDRCIGSITTSLCLSGAENDFRISVIDLDDLNVILLTTDGLSNSYSTDNDLHQWAVDIADYLKQEKGKEMIDANLGMWLDEVSINGSADDISIAVIVIGEEAIPDSKPKNIFSRVLSFISKSI